MNVAHLNQRPQRTHRYGFTIVELLVVIVVIGILAAIVVVVYNGITQRAGVAVLQSDLRDAVTQLNLQKVASDTYPNPSLPDTIQKSAGTTFQYTSNGSSFCLTATSSNSGVPAHYVSNTTSVTEGVCPGHSDGSPLADGSLMQTITAANCPSTRTRAVDARDNHTYWVQELADGTCWMLTNLAYAGGGTNTYGDAKTLTNGTSGLGSYTTAYYYIPDTGSNVTSEPTAPSTSTNGSGQYGYLYNWCAAMGVQTGTDACSATDTTDVNPSLSICPAGWRLPTGNGGQFGALNTAVNGGSTSSDAGLRTTWLGQRSGFWELIESEGYFMNQESFGYYWSSTKDLYSPDNAHTLIFEDGWTDPANLYFKNNGFAVRCVAN